MQKMIFGFWWVIFNLVEKKSVQFLNQNIKNKIPYIIQFLIRKTKLKFRVITPLLSWILYFYERY